MMYNEGDRVLEVNRETFKPFVTLDPGTVVDRDLEADMYLVAWDGEEDFPNEWHQGSYLIEAPADWVPQSLFNFNEGVDNSE